MSASAQNVNGSKSEAFSTALEEYKKKGANILLPSTRIEGLSDWHEPVIDQVYLDPDPKNGDVYIQDKGYGDKKTKYAISRQGLLKLSGCAGVIWHPQESRRVDDRKDKDYVSYQAVGGVRKADGTPFFYKAEYDLDFEVLEMELEEQYRLKAEKYEKNPDKNGWYCKMTEDEKREYSARLVRRDLLQKRRHKMKLAESGAMNRVIRALLSLKSSYTDKELNQPFVMARIVIKPDFNDKEVRRKMLDAAVQAMTGIYGGAPALEPVKFPHEGTIIDVPAETEGPDLYPDHPDDPDYLPSGKEPTEEPEGIPGDGESSLETDFRQLDEGAQIRTLEVLMERKGYKKKALKKPLKDFTEDQRIGFYAMLNEMENVEVTGDQNPF